MAYSIKLLIISGAQDDLRKVTEMAYDQVRVLGMNDKVGLVSFPKSESGQFMDVKPFSQQTSALIDSVRCIARLV